MHALNTYYFPLTSQCVVARDPMMAAYYYAMHHGDKSYSICLLDPTQENPTIIAKMTYASRGLDVPIHQAANIECDLTDNEGTVYDAESLDYYDSVETSDDGIQRLMNWMDFQQSGFYEV